jgi:hypothetical protein
MVQAAAPANTFVNDTNTGMYSAVADVLAFSTGGTDRARITSTGISTSVSLLVTGYISATNGISATGNVQATAYLHTSDARLKTDITPLKDPFKLLEGIHGVRYVWKRDGTPAYGVIAQDVIKTMPEAVHGGPSSTMVVDYDQFLAPLIESVKLLKADNDNLRLELKAANDNHLEDANRRVAEGIA